MIVPTLRVGMHPVTLLVTVAHGSHHASSAGRGASLAAFPRRAWERSYRCDGPRRNWTTSPQSIVRQRHLVIIRDTVTFTGVAPALRMFSRHHRRPRQRIAQRTVRVHHRIHVLLGRSRYG